MKFLRWLPIAAVALGVATSAAASENSSRSEFNERDFEAVMNFIKSKRGIPLAEKGCDLMISGDIRFEWANFKEKRDGERIRGKGAERDVRWGGGERIPTNEFDVEFNLMFDYRGAGSCTWAVAHLQFDNNAGVLENHRRCCGVLVEGCDYDYNYHSCVLEGDPYGLQGSGTRDKLCLRKAYFGWNLFEECNSRLDVELGRRNLFDVFDSRVQFRSCFDGILFRYSNCFECVGDFYVNAGAFIIDERTNHWGWVVEAGLLDIADYGIDFKYSFIDWAKDGTNRCNIENPWGMQYQVSQAYFAYNFNPELLCTRAKIYGAFIINHDADKREEFDHKKEDFAWYAGFLVGDVCKEGDWYFDINWQYVEAQAIPEWDLTGIGKGNYRDIPLTIDPAFGWTNYQGVRAEALYALTDNLALNPSWEYSEEIEDTFSPQTKYSKFELQVIYAF